jgi:hydrogenase maturation protein HypF
MCLGIPGRLIDRVEGYAGMLVRVDVAGGERQVNIGMLDDDVQAALTPGDWVLIHMGFVVEVVDAAGAEQAMQGLELMGRPRDTRVRRRLDVQGVVQGVGFRPFVYVTATELALTGSVANTPDGVVIEIEGDPAALDEFTRRLRERPPPLAMVVGVRVAELPTRGGTGFVIEGSRPGERSRTLASPDVATCPDCLAELVDPDDRRYRHPFITCTNCGPRFTIIRGLPYDRAATTMADFEMCAACRREYEDPADRRFHAQPIGCHDCGPTLEYVSPGVPPRARADALAAARADLRAGRIVAVKGLGGYHLACDAANPAAVSELRRRKRRGTKPFAVMVGDLVAARTLVALDDAEQALLAGPRRPIVLLPRLADAAVADDVAPGNADLGVMLAYTPLHTLLFGLGNDEPGPTALVMTSGNLGGEPIVSDDAEALDRLGGLADAWLRYDRPIEVPCDDSVVRVVDGAELAIRRSRGYAPLPLALPFEVPASLAMGGDLKSTCCVADGRYAWLSQHIGDMDDLATVDAFGAASAHLEMLTGVGPQQLVVDAHPGYHSGHWAAAHAAGREVTPVQHHHAHIAAVLAEHGRDGSTPVIGIAFDGTGYGDDKAIWGGEVLVADYKQYRRAGHLAYVPLAGGDASVQRPYRMALAHLRAAGVPWTDELPCVAACPADERAVLEHQLDTGFGCVPTSSMGRLFDAVASLVGVRQVVDYEAQAAIELEGVARGAFDDYGDAYEFAITEDGEVLVFDAAPVIRAVAADVLAGTGPAVVGARFHVGVAQLIAAVAIRTAQRTGLDTVALGGGVFQNVLLLRAARRLLTAAGLEVLIPSQLPPNDGGLALGQIMVAAQ